MFIPHSSMKDTHQGDGIIVIPLWRYWHQPVKRPVIRNMTPVVMFLARIRAAGRCFHGASFPWLSGYCCFQFWGVSGTCCSVTCSPCLLSDIKLNQFQDVMLHESQHASAHSLGCLFLMPISGEGFSRSTSSINFHHLYLDPPRDHGRSGAYSSYCNWWITPWRTIHTKGHVIVQVIYFTCKRFQRNQQHLLPLVCLWCKFQTIQGKQTHFFHIEKHYFDFKNTSSAQQREMRTGGQPSIIVFWTKTTASTVCLIQNETLTAVKGGVLCRMWLIWG